MNPHQLLKSKACSGSTNKQRVQFSHGLLGATTTSHGGKYVFERQGVLTGRPHLRPANGVIVVGAADRAPIEKYLREHGALVWIGEVVAQAKDMDALEPA